MPEPTYVPTRPYDEYAADVAAENVARSKGRDRRAYRCPLDREVYEKLCAVYEAKFAPGGDDQDDRY